MATRIRLNSTRTVPEAGPGTGWGTGPQADITRTVPAAGLSYPWTQTFDSVVPVGESKYMRSGATAPVEFWSERVAAEVAISGDISVAIYSGSVAAWSGKIRVRLYKITAGGSSIRTFLGEATSATVSVSGQSVLTVTPTPVTAVRGERFILIVTTVDDSPTGSHVLRADPTDSIGSWIEFTETITFLNNQIRLINRRTTTIGIENFFDMLEARGSSASTTGVVATEAGGTEIQWTRDPTDSFTATDISAAAVADTANATTYVSASFTPVANRLYLLAVTHSDTAPETTVPTVATTTGLTFVEVATIVFDTIASNLHRLTLFRAMKASGLSAGTYTVTLADAGTGCCARLTEVKKVVTTGTDGADAVINISTNNANAGSNPSVTLAAFDVVENGTYACFASDIATAPTAGSGFTGLGHSTIGTPTKGVFAEWQAANDTSANCTLASSDWAGIAVELVRHADDTIYLEWISLRVLEPFYVNSIDYFKGRFTVRESNAAANCTARIKIFRRAPDGTETEVYMTWGSGVELSGVSSNLTAWPGTSFWTTELTQAVSFQEDDRIIQRAYIVNFGTMADGHTCTLSYDHNVADFAGDSYMEVYGAFSFKAEGDPDGLHAIPDGLSMSGIGNDGA